MSVQLVYMSVGLVYMLLNMYYIFYYAIHFGNIGKE